MSGYFLRDGKCVACPPNCQKCASEERCDECDSFGFALDEASALCVPCTDGCTYCPDGADTCESCDIGYTQMGNGTDGCAKCTDPHW